MERVVDLIRELLPTAKVTDRHDALTLGLHCILHLEGLDAVGEGAAAAASLPPNWNTSGSTTIEYHVRGSSPTDKSSIVKLETLKNENKLIAKTKFGTLGSIQTIEFTVDDVVQKDPDYSNADRIYTLGIQSMISKFKDHLQKMLSQSNHAKQSQQIRVDPIRTDPLRADPMRADPLRADPLRADPLRADPLRADPLRVGPRHMGPFGGVGSRDLDPLGGRGMGGPHSGMHMDPRALLEYEQRKYVDMS